MNDRDEQYRERMLKRKREKSLEQPQIIKEKEVRIIEKNDKIIGIDELAFWLNIVGIIGTSITVGLFSLRFGYLDNIPSMFFIMLSFCVGIFILQYIWWHVFWYVQGCLWIVALLFMIGVLFFQVR